jgi:hypothetical protein
MALCLETTFTHDLNLIFDDAEDRVAGDLNVLKDARIVIAMMRARLSAG